VACGSQLARQVSEVRAIAEKRLHATVAGAAHRADPVLPADHLEAKAIDEALDLLSVLMATRLISTARRATDKERLSSCRGWRRHRGLDDDEDGQERAVTGVSRAAAWSAPRRLPG